jgi:transcriptional regulator with XRE-family HTH domain
MKGTEYNLMVAESIISTRELCRITQVEMASLLNMTQSNYCKYESGKKPISVGLLYEIAEILYTNVYQILLFADAKNKIIPYPNSLSSLLLRFTKSCECKGKLNYSETREIITTIKDVFNLDEKESIARYKSNFNNLFQNGIKTY